MCTKRQSWDPDLLVIRKIEEPRVPSETRKRLTGPIYIAEDRRGSHAAAEYLFLAYRHQSKSRAL